MIIHSPQDLANYMRDHRKHIKLSQGEVSERVGVRQETVSAFENKPERTKTETLFKLLSALSLELQIVPKGEQAQQGWDEEW